MKRLHRLQRLQFHRSLAPALYGPVAYRHFHFSKLFRLGRVKLAVIAGYAADGTALLHRLYQLPVECWDAVRQLADRALAVAALGTGRCKTKSKAVLAARQFAVARRQRIQKCQQHQGRCHGVSNRWPISGAGACAGGEA